MPSKGIHTEIRKCYEEAERLSFVSGQTLVPVSGKVFDEEEMINGVEAVLDGWWM